MGPLMLSKVTGYKKSTAYDVVKHSPDPGKLKRKGPSPRNDKVCSPHFTAGFTACPVTATSRHHLSFRRTSRSSGECIWVSFAMWYLYGRKKWLLAGYTSSSGTRRQHIRPKKSRIVLLLLRLATDMSDLVLPLTQPKPTGLLLPGGIPLGLHNPPSQYQEAEGLHQAAGCQDICGARHQLLSCSLHQNWGRHRGRRQSHWMTAFAGV